MQRSPTRQIIQGGLDYGIRSRLTGTYEAVTKRLHMKERILLIAACGLLTASPIAWSQCATGVNTGGGNCVPPDASGMPGYDPGNVAPPTIQPKWADSWGAIAIDPTTGSAGTVVDRASKSEANRAAMQDCGSEGSASCRIMESYYNRCAAVAWGYAGFGTAHNPTEDGAKDGAMESCNETKNQCAVVYSACSVARRIQ